MPLVPGSLLPILRAERLPCLCPLNPVSLCQTFLLACLQMLILTVCNSSPEETPQKTFEKRRANGPEFWHPVPISNSNDIIITSVRRTQLKISCLVKLQTTMTDLNWQLCLTFDSGGHTSLSVLSDLHSRPMSSAQTA